ncbi:MAG: ATP-dependent helicase [Pseudomonadota bacterium]
MNQIISQGLPECEPSIDYRGDLNPAQHEAATADQGPVLVIAGAGSGKTRTIVYRVAWLVEKGLDPHSVLLLTFTRKSSEEMLSRATRLLDSRIARVSGGTFHSVGNLILRKHASLLGYTPHFSIMDQGDAVAAVDHAKQQVGLPPPDTKGFPRSRTISEIFGYASGREISIEQALRARYPHMLTFADSVARIREVYEKHKVANNLMDYDDLLANTIRLLEEHDRVRAEISNRWQYILVDEYQDTNRKQAAMLKLLASEHDNVMVVGDDAQSIYSFRGADFRNIMEFPELFPGARIIKLEENYRSTTEILNVTNSIILESGGGYAKRLFTQNASGPLPLLVRPQSERDQSSFVVDCIDELKGLGVPAGEIAVLFRAGYHSFDLESELTRNGIHFAKYGGLKFLESTHIKDVLAHLRVVDNPQDRLSWARLLRLMPGIGLKTAEKLAVTLVEKGVPQDAAQLAGRGRKFFSPLQALLDLYAKLKSPDLSVTDQTALINDHYFPFLMENYDNYPKRIRELERLADLTVTYKSVTQFLNDMALEPPAQEGVESESSPGKLVLSTIHSAKGLEWHSVIILWACEGKLPAVMPGKPADEIEEERRLLYVATTRAKHNLVICAPLTMFDRQLGVVSTRLSRFFETVPREYLRTYDVR